MVPVVKFLSSPFVIRSRRRSECVPKSSALDAPPPPIDTTKEWEFGKYCWKAIVESTDKETGKHDRTFIGYSQNMNITDRTRGACDRHKKSGTECSEPVMVMKGGECDEVIFMKTKDGKMVNLTNPFH